MTTGNPIESGNLENLLNWDGDLTDFQELELNRGDFQLKVKVKSISPELNKQIEDQCTTISKKRGEVVKEIDERKSMLLQLYNCVVEPDLANEQLQSKFNAAHPKYRIVEKMFKIGEQIRLVKLMNRLSGFSADMDEMDSEVENLLSQSSEISNED